MQFLVDIVLDRMVRRRTCWPSLVPESVVGHRADPNQGGARGPRLPRLVRRRADARLHGRRDGRHDRVRDRVRRRPLAGGLAGLHGEPELPDGGELRDADQGEDDQEIPLMMEEGYRANGWLGIILGTRAAVVRFLRCRAGERGGLLGQRRKANA